MLKDAFISVIIPVYNNQIFVEQSIASAQRQKEVFEVIVIDDGSTDNTYKLLCELKLKYNKLKLLRHTFGRNKGIAASRNLGIKHSVCNWIAFLDSDDIYIDGRFNCASKIVSENPLIDGVYSVAQNFRDSVNLDLQQVNVNFESTELFAKLMKGDNGYFHTSTILAKKKLIISAGLFNVKLITCEDTELWLKISLIGKIIPDTNLSPVSKIRAHDNNIFNSKQLNYRHLRSHFLMFIYMSKFVKKYGSANDNKVFFTQFAEDYKNYFKMLTTSDISKWFIDVFPKLIFFIIFYRNRNVVFKSFKKQILIWALTVFKNRIYHVWYLWFR